MYIRRGIIVLCLFVAVTLQWITNAAALQDLQLHIPGGSYVGGTEQSWFYTHTPGSSFTLEVFSKKEVESSDVVFLSFALDKTVFPDPSDLSSISIVVDGSLMSQTLTGSNFTWGNPYGPPHGIFDTYYASIDLTEFADFNSGTIFNTETGSDSDDGYIASIDVTISGYYDVHFDSWGTIDGKSVKASSSHDAESTPVPEPATIALLSIGIVSLLGYRGRRFLKKS